MIFQLVELLFHSLVLIFPFIVEFQVFVTHITRIELKKLAFYLLLFSSDGVSVFGEVVQLFFELGCALNVDDVGYLIHLLELGVSLSDLFS